MKLLNFFSRRWKREHQKAEILRSFPPYIIPGNAPAYASPASAAAAANYITNLNKAAAMSAAAVGHMQQQQQQQQQQQRAVMQQGTPTEKRARWMAENYGQNIYAVSWRLFLK